MKRKGACLGKAADHERQEGTNPYGIARAYRKFGNVVVSRDLPQDTDAQDHDAVGSADEDQRFLGSGGTLLVLSFDQFVQSQPQEAPEKDEHEQAVRHHGEKESPEGKQDK